MTEPNIFTQYLNKRNSLVKNKKILQSSYIPESLPHRDDKINEIVEIIAPSLNKDKPSNILIIGKTGTGKTAVMNFIGKELKKADPGEENCSFIYINCEIVDTPYGILYNIASQIISDPARNIPFTGWSSEKILSELTSYIDEKNKIFIIVLDEIDRSFQKNGDDIFYYLTSINDKLQNSTVAIIGITNNTKFTEFLTNNNRDAWFVGVTPTLVNACWVGGDDRDIHFESMAMGQGASGALPVFALYMQQVYKDSQLGYNENAIFDLPAGYDPCSFVDEAVGNNDIDDLFE